MIAVLIILFFPLGWFLMWRYAPWRNALKWLWTVLVLLIFIVVFFRPASEEPDLSSSVAPTPVDASLTASV